MATETEQLVVALEARIRDFERNMHRANRTAGDNFSKIENRARQSAIRLERSMASASAKVSNQLKGLAGTLAAAFSARELMAITDSYTRFVNQLKVAGLEGSNLADTQNRLFAIAQKYGVQLEAVATLYGRNAASAKEMNLSQEDQLRIVEATSAALKTSGQTSEQAAGALLQLSQALGGTKIQAEEFNSLIDGARPLLQAVASGSDRWGGSVAKLTADVKAGNVATKDFVQALLAGSQGAIDQAGKATLTTSAAFETLRNSLVKYFGEADQTFGATNALAQAIGTLADNLDTVLPALAVISTALGVGFVANAARAALAGQGIGASLLGAFGGPIGIAITGIVVALASLAMESAKTQAALDGVGAISTDAANALNTARGRADSASVGVKGVGAEAAASEVKVRAFAGAVGEAAQKLYELARARQAALISELETKRQQASVQYSELWRQSDKGLKARVGAGLSWDSFKADLTLAGRKVGVLSNPETQLQDGMTSLKNAMGEYDAAIRHARDNLTSFATQPRTSSTSAASTGRTSTKGGGSGKSAADAAAEAEKRLQDRIKETTGELELQLRLSDMRAAGLDLQADKEEALARIHQQFPELVGSSNQKLQEQLHLMEALAIAGVERADAERRFADQEADAKAVFAARRAAREQEQEEEQRQIGQLADFYYDAFRTRGASIWEGFREAGLRAVSEILAKFTAGLLTAKADSGGGIGGLLGGALKLGSSLLTGGAGNSLGAVAGLKAATGGKVVGPGTGTSDSILAAVSNGEYVVNAKATRKHLALLEAINRGRVPAFSQGGQVGSPFAHSTLDRAQSHKPQGTPIVVNVDARGATNPAMVEEAANRAVLAAAPALIGTAVSTTVAKTRRPGIPRGLG